MNPRSLWLTVLAFLPFAAFVAFPVFGQGYPQKSIRIIVPFPAGGIADILASAIGQKLTEQWKQQVVVDNRPGAGANIGAEVAAKSPPDGYTLFGLSTAHTINPSLYSKLALLVEPALSRLTAADFGVPAVTPPQTP